MEKRTYVPMDIDKLLKFRKRICQMADAIDYETRIKPTSSRRIQLSLLQISDELMNLIVEGKKNA